MDFFLRPWRVDDALALADIYAGADTDLIHNIPAGRDLPAAQAWLDRIGPAEAEGSLVAFAVVAAGTPIGNVMGGNIVRPHSTAWISYWLTASARGQGIASAALRTLVDVLHDDHGIHRLELGYRVNNPASAAVAKSAGFLVEGREREKLLYDGVRYDTEVCARLAGDPRSPGHRLPVRPRLRSELPSGRTATCHGVAQRPEGC